MKRLDITIDPFVALLAFFLLLVIAVGIFSGRRDTAGFQQRDAIVQECLNSGRYSRAECIQLAGENQK